MKKYWILGMAAAALLFLLTGCGKSGAEAAEGKIVKPVAIMTLKEEAYPVALHYTGTIEAREVKKYSFKTAGKIAELFVEEGQTVRKGDKLALLEQEDLNFSLDAARAQMEAAKAQYDKAVKGAREGEIRLAELDVSKARTHYDFVKDNHEKIKKLYEKDAVPEQSLKEAGLELEQAADSLEQAEKTLALAKDGARDEEIEALLKQYETARSGYEANVKLVKDALLTADCDGYVLSVIIRGNEMAAAGSPVVVIGSSEYKGRVGLIREDVSKIKVGNEADVLIDNQETKGVITAVNKAPDAESRTYMADIAFDNTIEANIGAIIKVTIPTGKEKGIWVPIQYILNDGEDYVFVVENGRARRKNVKRSGMLEERACVEGLKEGERLITEGIKSVKDGYAVAVKDGNTNNNRME